jgi:hypothetical protein
MEVELENRFRCADDAFQITSSALARKLKRNAMLLLGDGESFKVVAMK